MHRRLSFLLTAAMAAAFAQGPPPVGGPDGAPPYPNADPPNGAPPYGGPGGAPNGPAPAASEENDPPSRAARLSYINGTVSFQPGSVDDWIPATMNRPMTTGDRLWTEAGARAEMHIGSAALRLNGRGNFAFLNLDDRAAQIQLSLGTLSVRVRRLAENENFEIDTPQVALSLLRPGEYRIEVNEAGDTTVVGVRGGEAEATAGGQAFSIKARDQVRIMANVSGNGGDQPSFDRREIPPADAFDNWTAERDRREDLSESGRYVSRDVPGYHDLDGAGVWRQDPEYGAVWAPRVEPGWAPYHSGHWAWIAPWGWTWVDDAPWGYAPFHYGRWAFVGAGWVWIPGPVVVGVRPVYAPAMVAWVGGPGFGIGIGVGVGVAAVGWFPLGPREVFVPAYGVGPAYFNRVNVSNTVVNNVTVTNVYNTTVVNRTGPANNLTYVNRNVAGAVTYLPQSAMTQGRPVSQAALVVPRGAVERAQVMQNAAVAPQREAVMGGRTAVTGTAAPPAALVNRQVVARNTPPPAPAPFAQQQQTLQQNPGQPLTRTATRQIQQSAPVQPRPMVRQVGPPAGATGGITSPATSPAGAQTIPRGQSSFGRPGGTATGPAPGGTATGGTPSSGTPSGGTTGGSQPQPQFRRAPQSTPGSTAGSTTGPTSSTSPSQPAVRPVTPSTSGGAAPTSGGANQPNQRSNQKKAKGKEKEPSR